MDYSRIKKQKLVNLDSFKPIFNEYMRYNIILENSKCQFLTHLRKDSEYLYVFNSSYTDRPEFNRLPNYQRWSWVKEKRFSSIFLADTSLEKDRELTVSWYHGSKEIFLIPKYIEILNNIKDKLNISSDRVIFIGSSSGGYASLMMAGYMKDSIAIVINPQINLVKYYKKIVKKFIKVIYENMEYEEFKKKYEERYNVVTFYQKINYIPNIYYIQCIEDEFHFNYHFKYFIKNLCNVNYHQDLRIITQLISDKKGHDFIYTKKEFFSEIDKAIKYFKLINYGDKITKELYLGNKIDKADKLDNLYHTYNINNNCYDIYYYDVKIDSLKPSKEGDGSIQNQMDKFKINLSKVLVMLNK
jgi:hypothetical protein